MNGLFITGSDTEVGKTWVSCAAIRSLRHSFARVGAYKPVASGVQNQLDSDAYRLWEATGFLQSIEMVCPQCFAAPLAPPLAAELEGVEVDRQQLVSGANDWSSCSDFLVVEGAGGLLSPLTFEMTNADLAVKLGWPIVLVVANKLGAVNQSLMALEVAQSKGLVVAAIVLNETTKCDSETTYEQHARMLQKQTVSAKRTRPPIVRFQYGQSEWDNIQTLLL